MHIGFITPEYPCLKLKDKYGGIGTFIKNLSLQLISKGHSVSIFVSSQQKEEIFVEEGVKIHFVAKKKIKGLTWLLNRLYFNKYVNKYINIDKIDILEAPEWTGFTALMKFICPLIIRLHGSDTYFCHLENRHLKRKNKFFEKNALKNCDAIIGVSHYVAEVTKKLFSLNCTIEVIHNTVDTDKIKPNHSKINKKTLLYFGSIIRKKGVLEIAPVFNNLVKNDNEIKLLLIGNNVKDIKENKMTLTLFKNKLSEKSLKNFEYITAVSYAKVIDYIHRADVILLPSFAEAFPMTWLEAMAMEKKLVTSNIGWAKELMVDGVTGFTVNPLNHENFYDKVKKLVDEKNTSLLGVNARQHLIENFNATSILNKNINFYQKTINEI